jgi:indolepyruvate ferredoxin oxidoreductase
VTRETFNIVIGGIGGTGVTSIGAILGTAAHIEGKTAATLDMMGLAQKGGAVTSFVRVAAEKARINGPRVPTGQADVLIGCDIVMSAKPDTFGYLDGERTVSIVNDGLTPTAAFVTDNTINYDMAAMRSRIARASRRLESIDAEELALRLLGDTIYANMFQTGYAYQLGEIPIGEEAILKAIELNGAAVKANQRAFRLGRLAAHDRAAILKLAGLDKPDGPKFAESFEEIVAKRVDFLTAYQNAAYAARYRTTLDKIRAAEAVRAPGKHGLAEMAARALFKLMAYKDEYEVARLYTSGEFHKKLNQEFEGNFSLSFHLAPPIFGATDPNTGRPRKMEFGSYMMSAFRVLAALKGLRGTWLDIFARNPERKLEVAMIGDYERLIGEIAAGLTPANHATALALAELPLEVKGYGYIKDANYKQAKAKEAALLRRLLMTDTATPAPITEAAE